MRLNQVISIIVVNAVGFSSYAANLSYYREQLPRLKVMKDQGAKVRVENLRKRLGTQNSGNLVLSAGDTTENRIYSSVYFKDLLGRALQVSMSHEKNDAPIPFDPAWSQQEQKENLTFHKHQVSIRALMSPTVDHHGKKVSGITSILNEIRAKLVNPEKNENKGKITAQRNSKLNFERVSKITEYLKKAPVGTTGRKISDIFGNPVAVDFIDGHAQRIIFKNHTYEIEASLPMFITARIGEDSAFLDIQEHLITHLLQQKEVLTKRQEQLSGSNVPNIDKVLLWFYEGVASPNLGNEPEFINSRLDLIRAVLPYLEQKFKLSKRTSYLLANLSSSQMNYLIDMFLQLRGDDILSDREFAAFGQDFATFMGQSENKKLEADYQNYSTMARLISKLEMHLAEEQNLAQAKEQDLRAIRSGRR